MRPSENPRARRNRSNDSNDASTSIAASVSSRSSALSRSSSGAKCCSSWRRSSFRAPSSSVAMIGWNDLDDQKAKELWLAQEAAFMADIPAKDHWGAELGIIGV